MSKHAFNLTSGELPHAHLRGVPASSWWMEEDARRDFAAAARGHQDRMAQSTLGKSSALVFGRDHGREYSRKDNPTELEAR
jgi:hypothetical protein